MGKYYVWLSDFGFHLYDTYGELISGYEYHDLGINDDNGDPYTTPGRKPPFDLNSNELDIIDNFLKEKYGKDIEYDCEY